MFPELTRDDVFRIETRRLWLRWPRARDAEAIVRLAGERALAEMTARIPHPLDRAAADAFVIAARRDNAEGRALTLALAPRPAPDALVGVVAIGPDPAPPGSHLGYWLGRPHRGQGLMREAAHALIDAWFAYAGACDLGSSALVENAPSRRLLEACGFARGTEALRAFPARGGDRRVVLFHLTRAGWSARRGSCVGTE